LDALFRESPAREPPPSRPRPCFKSVRAAWQRDDEDSTEPQVQTIFGWMAEQVAQRNPDGKKADGGLHPASRSLTTCFFIDLAGEQQQLEW